MYLYFIEIFISFMHNYVGILTLKNLGLSWKNAIFGGRERVGEKIPIGVAWGAQAARWRGQGLGPG